VDSGYCPKYLVMITADANNNKFYRMIPKGDTFTVEYGRIGNSNFQTKTYPRSDWCRIYNSKVKKGYADQSDLMDVKVESSENKYKPIENQNISKIVDRLIGLANDAVKKNYTVSSEAVTQKMIDEADKLLIVLAASKNSSVNDFNKTLTKLFSVIPRAMKKVSDYLAKTPDDFAKIFKREQDLLDVMRGMVKNKVTVENQSGDTVFDKTILEMFGLTFEETNDDDIDKIKKSLGHLSDKYKDSWKVTNIKTQSAFDSFVKDNSIADTKMLWHGSRNENWWSIASSGLLLKPNAIITGKMFGYGIYYANSAQKSFGYTSHKGSYWANGNSDFSLMGLYDVAYGKPFDVYQFDSKYYNFNYDKLKKTAPLAHCLHAHKGSMLRNDEIIIYREDQCTIKYLVELT